MAHRRGAALATSASVHALSIEIADSIRFNRERRLAKAAPRVLRGVKPAFHDTDIDTDTDIPATILADTSDTRDFQKLFAWQAERGSRPTRRHHRDDLREDVVEAAGILECGL